MRFSRNEEGQALTEYAMTLVLIAIVVVVILAILGAAVKSELWVKAWNELRCAFTGECSSLLPVYLVTSQLVLLL